MFSWHPSDVQSDRERYTQVHVCTLAHVPRFRCSCVPCNTFTFRTAF